MISIFTKKGVADRNLSESSYFDGIKNGQWQDEVLNYRAKPSKDAKKKITGITASGVFKERTAAKIIEHSGFLCMDIDAKDQICTIDFDGLKEDKYTYCLHKSLGGFGYALFIKIDKNKHIESFLGIENYLFINYGIVIDKSCKDVSRLRFVSYDPDLFLNEDAKTFKQYLKKKDIVYTKTIVIKTDFDTMVNEAKSKNLFEDYADYIKCAFALSEEFGEFGRSYFHTLCQGSQKYNYENCDKDFDKALKRRGAKSGGVTIAFLYKIFKDANISLTSEKTEQIKSIAKLSDNPKASLKEAGIDDTDNILDKLQVDENKEKTNIDLVIDLIRLSKIRFNEISRNYEIAGEIMNDALLAQFTTNVWQRIDEDFSSQKIWTLIQNRKHTESYNPLQKWFFDNLHIETNDEFLKLVSCFEIDHKIFIDNVEHNLTDYLQTYLKKWMLGLIGSAFGTYSLMILVLNGEQGVQKTNFFRFLLPEKLRCFYSESNLDEGKDSEILMTKKWLIVDDEFGGKSKKDATKLKRLSSQQVFTVRAPYGRISEDLRRLAVLGGTSNDSEVINDPTGNRRIIPVNIISFDFEKYKSINKDKLWIEIYKEWEKDKEGWFLTKSQIEWLNGATIKNAEIMQEVELINEHFEVYDYGSMTNSSVKISLESKFSHLKTNSKRIGQALKLCGYQQKIKSENGKTSRFYNIIAKNANNV